MNKTVSAQNALGRETGLIYRLCFISGTCSLKRQDTGKNKWQPDSRQMVRREGEHFWKLLMCHSEQQVFSSDWRGEDESHQQGNKRRSEGNGQKQVGGSKHQHLGRVRD